MPKQLEDADGAGNDRIQRIIDAVRAHAGPIEATEMGILRVSWSGDGGLKLVLESHFPKEPRRGQS
jgi:hypothetical protein